jgi:VIT1/CCC1 family predicted Fe2+/Mn2+ transporter
MSDRTYHPDEPHGQGQRAQLNWLRAGVLGANDGIVSIAALLLGVIATGLGEGAILLAGIASTIAGAVSMALGEYVSVSAQRDTEKKLVALERWELQAQPEAEHQELTGILMGYGITADTADQAAREVAKQDPLAAHLQLELGMDSQDLTNPFVAALSSALAFLLGALLPLLSVFFAPAGYEAPVVTTTTLVALALTGFVSAVLSKTSRVRSCIRLVVGGALGLALTYGVGSLFGG